jgi:atypical dual specificity phosphatase
VNVHPVVELEGFGVAYGDRTVLRDLTAAVAPQGCTVLLGPAGTGKSTLLRTLAGYNQALPQLRTWGECRYRGTPQAPSNRPALVMQNSRLLVASVLENLVCMLPGRGSLTRAEQLEAVRVLLAECGQESWLDLLDRQVVALPLGIQRAIAIVREAAASPHLLMIDEPTQGLTPAEAQGVLGVVQAVARRRAVLLVLHNLQEARQAADHVLLLSGGVFQEARAAADFFAAPASESGRLFLASGSCPEPAAEPEPRSEEVAAAAAPAPAPSAALGPRGFVWLVPGRLAGTPWPGIVHGADYDLSALRNVGVTHLVSLTESPFDPLVAAGYGIACVACPIPDMHPPSARQALALCSRIDRLLGTNAVVAVHCHAGLGRTGTVLAAYWLWRGRGGLTAVRALEDVRRLEPGWVQSEAQVRFLQEFALVVANALDTFQDFIDPVAAGT